MNVSFLLLLYLGNLIDIQKMCWFLERAGSLLWHALKSLKIQTHFWLRHDRYQRLTNWLSISDCETRSRGEKEMKWNICHCRRKIKARIYYSFFSSSNLLCSARWIHAHTGIQSLIILFIQFIHSLKYYILLLHTTQISAMINSEEGMIWRVFWFLCTCVCVML